MRYVVEFTVTFTGGALKGIILRDSLKFATLEAARDYAEHDFNNLRNKKYSNFIVKTL